MAKYVCQVCGYVYEGDAAPAECPICHAPASKFTKQEEGKTWAAEHVVGVAKGAPEDIIADLRRTSRVNALRLVSSNSFCTPGLSGSDPVSKPEGSLIPPVLLAALALVRLFPPACQKK